MHSESSSRLWTALICLLCGATYAIRLTGPNDLESYAQVLNVGYILDLMTRGNWLVQYDLEGAIMSKPPIHTWLMAPFAATLGLNRLALTLPSFIAVLALALVVLAVGRQRFGPRAGLLAAMAMALPPAMAKQVTLVRTDAVFMLTVALAAFVAYLAWERGRNGRQAWFLYWVLMAIATLIKGPLGVILASGGLVSHFWERRTHGDQAPLPQGPHLIGLLLFLTLTLGWFLAAWLTAGQALIDKMLFSELIYHAVQEHSGGWQWTDLVKPTFFLLVRHLPFSIPLASALWRVFRTPAEAVGERRFERFLTCWILVGLIIFSLAKHQRADHLLPLWPACALLAGRELSRWSSRLGPTWSRRVSVVCCILLLGLTYAGAHSNSIKHAATSAYGRELKLAADAEAAAKALKASGLDATRFYHMGTPLTLQLHLGTFRQFINREELERILRETEEPIDLALGKQAIEDLNLITNYPATRRVFRWPTDESSPPVVQVFRIAR